MRKADGAPRSAAFAVLAVLLASVASPGAGGEGAGGPGGWRERSLGWFTGLPERKSTAADNGIEAQFLLRPGTGIALEREGRWPAGGGERLDVTIFADNVNRTSRDYDAHGIRFPVSITVVFGEDREPLPVKRRIRNFFSGFLHGFPPKGIRITYAWGNVVPTGSMFRPADEEAVFTLAGAEEGGRRIAARRVPADDFRAVFGRRPKGPVTMLIVAAGRPRKETGEIRSGIAAAFPAR